MLDLSCFSLVLKDNVYLLLEEVVRRRDSGLRREVDPCKRGAPYPFTAPRPQHERSAPPALSEAVLQSAAASE